MRRESNGAVRREQRDPRPAIIRQVRVSVAVGSIAVWLLASSCGAPAPRFDRRDMLRDLTANVLLPTYRDLAARTSELRAATDALCAAPSTETLSSARAAWHATREPLQGAWLFHFGPAMDDRILADVDFWPSRPDTIEASLAGAPADITPAWVATLGVSGKGLPALEYLLFDPARDDATLIATLGDSATGGARRCAYAAAIASEVERQTARLRDAWEPASGSYATTFTEEGSAAYPTLHDAVSVFYNAVFSATDAIKVRKIGTPQGRQNGGVPLPESTESRLSDHSVDDMIHGMHALRSVFTGTRGAVDGLGLEDAIAEIRPDAVPDVLAHIDAAIVALESDMPRPYDEHLADPIVEGVYQRMVAVVRVMSTDVAALLAVTVSFTDNDGD